MVFLLKSKFRFYYTFVTVCWLVHTEDIWRIKINPSLIATVNPLTPEAFCEKGVFWTFWCFLGWISGKLALMCSKMHLHHDSLAFLPLASRFVTFWVGRAQKSKFWGFWARKWPMSQGFSIFGIFFSSFLFLLCFPFRCGDWPSNGLACG